jgi:serine/threonine-protein kinase
MNVQRIASRYKILRELGRGGMGVVYLVEHEHTGERLALKLLHGSAATNPNVIARFKREARVGAQIKSEHVVRVTDADVAPELGGAPFFVMELLEGFDLERAVEKLGRLQRDAVVGVLSQLAKALDKAHAIGVVHRDLKPENIFLHRREDGSLVVKVLDFGISKFLMSDGITGIGATADGTMMGTPAYMAPEQARGAVQAMGPATDVWAIGLIAIRLLTAELYWTAGTQPELMVQLLVAPMVRPAERWPWLGEAFDAWFARSCDRDPAARWRSVSEQVTALDQVLRATEFSQPGIAAGGASMATLLDAVNKAPVEIPDAPLSNDARVPTASVAMGFGPPFSVPSQGATTGSPESITVPPSPASRRARPAAMVVASVVILTMAGLGYRLFLTQRPVSSLEVPEASVASDSARPAMSAATLEKHVVTSAETLAAQVDAGAHESQSVPGSSAETANREHTTVSGASGVGPRRAPRPTPKPARQDDPLAP